MTGDSICPEHPAAPTERFGRCVQTAGFALLLAVVAARPFLGEMTFRSSVLRGAFAAASTGADQIARYDRSELARVHLGSVLLAGCLLWFIGGAIRGRLAIRYGFLLWAIVAFGVLSFISAQYASDKRAALNGWMEQVSLISAGFVALQICADRRRFAMVMIVLAALGGALAVKGIYQYFVEAPERIVDFRMYHAERLAALGWAPETPQARLIRLRMLDKAPFGFFSLANLYASLMVVLLGSGVGLAADKIAHAARGFDQWRRGRRGAEIHTPTLAALLGVLVPVGVVVALVLTRSRGAIAAAAAATVAGILVGFFGSFFARHWRKAVLIVVSVFLLGAGLVIAYGLKHDRLPTRTMRYRWYYWTGAAEVLADRPVLGAGAGNFHTAYLPHRRPEAEEEVKTPHNVVMHALSQYGLLGGL
ncbi:MAG: O-antigen ligase family protein, partial [Phycisphaerae bacterium]|nr:O-antigen ligase family protein [Phycisphaerae bacterium]